MNSIAAAQPTFDFSSFIDFACQRIVVEVQLFGAEAATIWVLVCRRLHVLDVLIHDDFSFDCF